MPNFKVAVLVNSSQVFIVNALNMEEAIDKISDAWNNGSIALDNPDIENADFSFIGKAPDNIRADL